MLKHSELLLAASVPLLWGIGFTFAKAGLNEFPPLFLMGLRFSLASLALVLFVPIPRGQRDLVSCPFPQSCLKGYVRYAPASCIHDCLKYALSAGSMSSY